MNHKLFLDGFHGESDDPRNAWADSYAASELAKIIIEEVFGYHTTFKGPG